MARHSVRTPAEVIAFLDRLATAGSGTGDQAPPTPPRSAVGAARD